VGLQASGFRELEQHRLGKLVGMQVGGSFGLAQRSIRASAPPPSLPAGPNSPWKSCGSKTVPPCSSKLLDGRQRLAFVEQFAIGVVFPTGTRAARRSHNSRRAARGRVAPWGSGNRVYFLAFIPTLIISLIIYPWIGIRPFAHKRGYQCFSRNRPGFITSGSESSWLPGIFFRLIRGR